AFQSLSTQQLEQLLEPIAVYPDPLIAQILPASTVPSQIVLADRYLASGGDPSQVDQQPWDASVQALARFPTVLKWMDDNLNWTTDLGQAFLNQPQDVMDAIQRLRAAAQSLGNLQSTSQQQIVEDGGTIEILPTNPQVIYVPYYSGDTIYTDNNDGAALVTFGIGFAIGDWFNSDFDWQHRRLVIWNRDHPRPANWWHERPNTRAATIGRNPTVWHPYSHRGLGQNNGGDRGWVDRQAVHPVGPLVGHSEPRPMIPREAPPRSVPTRHESTATRPKPAAAPAAHPAPVSRPAANSAFLGIQNSRQTRTDSNRGQQSLSTVTRAAPASHAAPAPSESRGRGNQGSDSAKKR
ncbi:MAG: DUF3300 domain-containing protein, partial [Lacunisphaera sp.]